VDSTVFIALINPCMSLIFAAAFLLLSHHQSHLAYIRVLAWAFVAIACGFLLQYFVIVDVALTKLASNLFFLAGGVGMALGGLARYGRTPPLVSTVVFATCGLAAFSWYLFVEPDITWRIYAINFAFGAITLIMAAELRGLPNPKLIDRFLLAMVTFWGLTFFVRPVIVVWYEGNYVSYDNFHNSLYWITLTVSSSLFLLLFALALITAITLDLVAELKRESQTDPLSGLLNRRGFEEGVDDVVGQARRRTLPISLVVCDLDHFKAVNDTHGHAAGDNVIVTFAACLRDSLGAGQLAGRVGGEEFAVLLEGANLSTARLFAEGARSVFAAAAVPDLPDHTRFTASFGVAEWMDGESVASLFVRADHALYEAKKAGRDCVRTSLGHGGKASAKRGRLLLQPL